MFLFNVCLHLSQILKSLNHLIADQILLMNEVTKPIHHLKNHPPHHCSSQMFVSYCRILIYKCPFYAISLLENLKNYYMYRLNLLFNQCIANPLTLMNHHDEYSH